jgi:hypothetical protein
MEELGRMLRYVIGPAVTWLVVSGYMPEAMQGQVTESVVQVLAFVVPWLWSRWRQDGIWPTWGQK